MFPSICPDCGTDVSRIPPCFVCKTHDDTLTYCCPCMHPHKWGSEIQVGDVVHGHSIALISPYGPSNLDFVDDRWRVMHSGDWRCTLDPDAGYVQRANGAWTISHRLRPRP